jgi:hypothetical protein
LLRDLIYLPLHLSHSKPTRIKMRRSLWEKGKWGILHQGGSKQAQKSNENVASDWSSDEPLRSCNNLSDATEWVDLLSRYRFLLPSTAKNEGRNITNTMEAIKVRTMADKVPLNQRAASQIPRVTITVSPRKLMCMERWGMSRVLCSSYSAVAMGHMEQPYSFGFVDGWQPVTGGKHPDKQRLGRTWRTSVPASWQTIHTAVRVAARMSEEELASCRKP